MRQLFVGTLSNMVANGEACPGHVWVLAEIGETRGRLDIAPTCSVCGALNDEAGGMTPGDAPPSW
jgi:hypothetical protein